MEVPNSKLSFNTYRTGIKNLDFYTKSHPYGGGINYNINKDWSVYGGIGYNGKDFTKATSYGPEIGVSYHPSSCKIFWAFYIKFKAFKINI